MHKPLLLMLATALLAGCFSINGDLSVGDREVHDGGLRTVNGSIRVGSEAAVGGNVRTVNGSIEIGRESMVLDVQTVNGKIRLGTRSTANELESVNGNVEVLEGARVNGDVSTVNGRILLGPDAVVDGEVQTVNGQIRLEGAIAGSLRNARGGMVLEAGSRVLGPLRVERSGDRETDEPVLIEIHADCVVEGPLVFERPVRLRVHESATIGDVQGAEVERFSD